MWCASEKCHHVTVTAVASVSFAEVRSNLRETKAALGCNKLSTSSGEKMVFFTRLKTLVDSCVGAIAFYCGTVARCGYLILGPGAVRHHCVHGHVEYLPHGVHIACPPVSFLYGERGGGG